MKRNRAWTMILLGLALSLLLVGAASAAGTDSARKTGVTVLVNGVSVVSEANHVSDGKTYVSIQAFADLLNKEYELGTNSQSVKLDGKTITGIRMKSGKPTAWIRDLAAAVSAQSVTWDQEKQEAYMLVLPEGTIKISDVVPMMGEHWSNPQAGELPNGPIYGVYNGKLVFLEYMIAQEDFNKGTDHVNLNGMKGLPSPSVDHMNIEFQPHGHEGFEVPHFDLHAYFISAEEQMAIQ